MEKEFYIYYATITGVYDGDSCTAQIDLGFSVNMTMKLRLLYIDTPELRGDELEDGRKVRDIVRDMILDKDVIIRTKKDSKGKYGRYLAEIFVDGLNLNTWLLDNGYAKPYLG